MIEGENGAPGSSE